MDINTQLSLIEPELYFLIQRFLLVSPLQETYRVLCKELENKDILPMRLDWKGKKHKRSCNELEKLYPHVGPKHLLQICGKIGPILDKENPPSVEGVISLLGAGRQSLLRTNIIREVIKNSRVYATRKNGMPMVNSLTLTTYNIANVLLGRESSGPVTRSLVCPSRYCNLQLQRQTLGHLSAVYCLMFDHSGKYIITGADDLLIKIWSSVSGRLLSTCRGASAEITDIDINLENTLLAAGSIDRILRIWNLQSGVPIAAFTGHTGMITSVNFCPLILQDVRYVVTTSTDGSVAFWAYTQDTTNKVNFVSKPIIYQERMRPGQAKMICASFSPGGCFLATGSADHHVRVYHMASDEGPRRILEMEAHTDRVDSIQWAHRGLQFVSGSKDGTAHIWHFECQQWKSRKLSMNAKLPNSDSTETEDLKKLKVTMVAWDISDMWIITAVVDYKLKVWAAETGELYRILSGHSDEIYVLESHPKDPHIVLSAGHDGQLYVWNILHGKYVAHFTNNIEGQGYGAVFDAKWSPCGNMIAASDSHGHILIFGFGSGNSQMKMLPKELFFHTDYRPLVRDANHMVLDEQTQIAPHLMPPPFLVDIDGNPYPPMLQRLVPGRENCESEQLIPNIVVGTEGTQEVIEGLPEEQARYDLMAIDPSSSWQGPYSRLGVRTGMRTSSDVEGIRQSSGNWQRDPNKDWGKRLLVKPLEESCLSRTRRLIETLATKEMTYYNREMRHRPIMINTNSNVTTESGKAKKKRKHYHTRSAEVEGSEPEQDDGDANSSGSEYSTSKDAAFSDSSSSGSESSGYSDWVADQGVSLEPPKRSKRKQVARHISPVNDEQVKSKWEPHDIPPNVDKIKEVPENYKQLDWLAETMPKKVPYFPQMGDEVVYFRQGHQLYVNAVQTKSVYEMNPKDFPWIKNQLKDCEFVKIVGIKYEIRPPRLCCLKLALLDGDGRLTGSVFTVKYHDMPDVIDFFVLKQTYEVAISRLWNPGDRFRCMIDDAWWIGEVVSKSAVSEEFLDSLFMCYEIRWDNGEYERMSPWDMEPLKEDRMPANPCEAVPVLPEEIQSMLYQPQIEEWPHGDREGSTKRIIRGLDSVMGLAIAEPFLVPVDINEYPSYAMVVEYPIDLSTIKARFENNFYRRITSSQFDVRYLATNAEKFNKPHSIIVKRARIITELCLRIIKASTEVLDVNAIYHQLMDTYESSDSEADVDIFQPGPSSTTRNLRPLTTRNFCNPDDWKTEARKLLDALWRCEDSAPFRAPVDHIKHPDYYQIIDTPMDLSSVKEDLCGGNYEIPHDFYKDMKLIFQNSKNYNTNKRSRIYAMTVRLSAMFEEHMGRLIYNWKMAMKRSKTRRSRMTDTRKTIDPSTSEDEDTSSSPIRSSNQVAKNVGTSKSPRSNVTQSTSSYKNCNGGIKRKLPPQTYINGNKSTSSVNDSNNSDDSDYAPLSKWKNSNYKEPSTNTRNNRKKISDSSSSDSDVIRKTMTTRNSKRPRYVNDDDSDDESVSEENVSYSSCSENDNDPVVTVSSRGRIRRMTARARALLKK